jgi:uncharacterized delta-60 repeat protein
MVKLYSIRIFFQQLLFAPLLILGSSMVMAQIGSDALFNPTDRGFGYGDGPNGIVLATKAYNDGRVLIAGAFTRYSGANRKGIARLKGANGLDSTFQIGSGFEGGFPQKMALQADGRILVVGSFTSYNGLPANRIVRLLPDGTRDPSFDLAGTGPSGDLKEVIILPGGSIYVAGNFATFNGLPIGGIARLFSNGQPDPAFSPGTGGPGTNGSVEDLEVFNDGSVLVAGKFNGTFNSTPSSILIRLQSNGSLFPGFVIPACNGGLKDVELDEAGNSIFAAGAFTSFAGETHNHIVRLSLTGIINPGFISPFGSSDGGIEVIRKSGTNLFIAGTFRKVGSLFRGRFASLQISGQTNTGFATDSGANGPVFCMDFDAAGRVVLGGRFTRIDQRGRNNVARIGVLGLVDAPFSQNTGADRSVFAVAVQADRKVILGGEFGYFNWSIRNGITRLFPNGQVDPSFQVGNGIDGVVKAIVLQSDGKILVGGCFQSFNNLPRRSLIRLNPDGSLDLSFNPGTATPDTIFALAVQKNGRILIGGDFSSFSGIPSAGLIRLLPNGNWDNSFSVGTGFDGPVRAISIMRDSLVFIGGAFSEMNGNGLRRGIVRLDLNGGYIPIHNSGIGLDANGTVYSIAIQKDRKVVLGGLFNAYNGNPSTNLVRISPSGEWDNGFIPGNAAQGPVYDLLIDSVKNTILAVGDFAGNKAIGRNSIVRIKSNGSKDGTSGSGKGAGGAIFSAEPDSGNAILIAGDFDSFDETGRNRVARLEDTEVTTTTWNGTEWDFGTPDSSLNATIAGAYSGSGFDCQDFIIQAGKVFQPSSQVRSFGAVQSNSQLITGQISLTGSSSQVIQGYFQDLTLDNSNGSSLSGLTQIRGTLKLQAGTLTTGGNLTLTSTAASTARVASIEPGAGITGNVTVRRFVPGSVAGWHFMGVPVSGQTQSDWSDNFTLLPNFIFFHNESGSVNIDDQVNGWEFATGPLEVGKGYRVFLNQSFFNGNPVIDNTGPLVTGNHPFNISVSPGGFDGGGWNFLSNPFACEVDWHGFSKNLISGQLHYWNNNQYGSYSEGTGLGVNGGGRYIPSFQGFFVKATGSGASLSVPESAKPLVPQNPTFLRVQADVPGDVVRMILRGPGSEKDESAIRWMPEANGYFEPEYDADKLINPGLSFFSTTSDGRRTAIQARNFQQADSLLLGYEASTFGPHFLEIHIGEEMFQNRDWLLRDNMTGFEYPLTADMLHPFEVQEGLEIMNFRFTLVVKDPPVGLSPRTKVPSIFLYPNPARQMVEISGLPSPADYFIQDGYGKKVAQGHWEKGGRKALSIEGLPSGMYFLEMKGEFGKVTRKLIIE